MELWATNKFFEEILNISPDTITQIVVIACIMLGIGSVFIKKLREIAPALMVSAGIIGTFWGTFIALADFQTGADHKTMVESIPNVLGGMKAAFVTSLIGLISAFVSKFILHFLPRFEPKPLPVEENTIGLLQEIKDGIIGEKDNSLSSRLNALQAEYRDGMKDLKQSIAGDGDSSIASQLTKLRNENSDGLKKIDGHMEGLADTIENSLVKNMEKLMEDIRKAIVEQLVDQLKQTNEVLREQLKEMLERIEDTLINQFGETFKQFNEATQAIKKWQEDHREQVEQLTKAFEMTAVGIENIRANCEIIPDTMQQLKGLMGELDERLKAFANMKDKAEESFPMIKQNLDIIGANLQKSAEGFSGLEKTIENTYTRANGLMQQHSQNVETQINQSTKAVEDAAKYMIAQTRNASNQHQEEIRNIINEIENTSKHCLQETQEKLTRMAEQHIKSTDDIMTEVITSWGKNVTGIANKARDIIEHGNRR